MPEQTKTYKEPWGEGTPWKNSVAFFTYLRGCLRRAWSRNPIKIELLKKGRKRISNPTGKGKAEVWGFDCELCKRTLPQKVCEVDHIVPCGALAKKEDIAGFVERLLFVTEADLRLVCKGCNSAMAYSEKHGISYEDAVIEKQVIAAAKESKAWLLARGITPAGNATKRREQIREVLKNDQRTDSTD